MKRNNIVAVVSFSVIFVVVFAFIVPLIVYPSGYGDYEVFREIEQFRTWIDENTQDFKEGTDSYIGEIEPKSQLIGSFVYGDKEYSFAAYIFKEEKDRKIIMPPARAFLPTKKGFRFCRRIISDPRLWLMRKIICIFSAAAIM